MTTPAAASDNTSPNKLFADLITEFTRALKGNHTGHRTTEPSTYDGTRDAMVIDSWIRTLERYADFHGWDHTRMKNYAVTLLRGRADVWYRTLEIAQDEPEDWLTLKRELIAYFRPENATRLARDKLAGFHQTGSLVDYINGYMDIIAALPKISEDESCDRFMRGLSNRNIRAEIRHKNAETLQEAIHVAMSYDAAQHESGSYYRRYQDRSVRPVQREYRDDPMDLDAVESRPRMNGNLTCFYCGNKGHRRVDCRIRKNDIAKLEQEKYQKFRNILVREA